MSLPKYPTYKDSGVEWLGEVPGHWGAPQLKRLVQGPPLYGANIAASDYASEGIRFLRTTDLASDGGLDAAAVAVYVDPKQVEEADLRDGDLLVSRSGSLGTSYLHEGARFGAASFAGYLVRFRPLDDVVPRFLFYWTKTQGFIAQIDAEAVHSTISNFNGQRYAAMRVPRPTRGEQVHIAAFLDRETAKIDALVAEQQRLIALLKEKRQAVISHAVTKGLNPGAPMRDSGIEWLGEVPAHWSVTRLKHATSLIVDCPHETPTLTENGAYLMIRTPDIDQGAIFPKQMRAVDAGEYRNRIRRAPLLRGDIVYSREGERWGHAALVPEADRFCLGQRMMQLRANGEFAPEYLMLHLNAKSVYVQGDVETVGATSPHINVGTICNFRVAAPLLDEQTEIAAHLGKEVANLDLLTFEAQRAIDLLQERRTALISAAVTGQIDVRPAADRAAV